MRQTIAVTPQVFFYYTCIVAGSLQCPLRWILRKLRTPQRVCSLSHCLRSSSFVTAAPVSFAALHSYAPHFASLHLVRSCAICFKVWPAHSCHTELVEVCSHIPFASQCYNTHWVSFRFVRRYFISVLLSPPAANNFARRQPHFGCVHLATANCSCRTSISQSIAKVHLHSSAASVPCGKYTPAASYGACIGLPMVGLYCQPLVGARCFLRSFVPHSLRQQWRLATNATAPQVCGAAMFLFCRRRFYRPFYNHCNFVITYGCYN